MDSSPVYDHPPHFTEEERLQREKLYAYLNAHPYGEQDENGVDVSLLRENLKLTPRERLAKLQYILRTIPIGDKEGGNTERDGTHAETSS